MSDNEDLASEKDVEWNETQGDIDEKEHALLLRNIVAMDGKSTTTAQRREAATMSEHHAPTGRDQVKLHELVRALKEKSSHADLKKQLQRVKSKEKVLNVPLTKPQQERVHRGLSYENVTKEVSKWNSVVQANRHAEQLKFPLEQPDLRVHTSADELIKRTKPTTSLEIEVAALLGNSGHTLDIEKELTPAEERALQAMSLEEAAERRAELQKYRALLSYKEAKARRQKKIKSKKYHRILQKEKLKKEKKTLEEMEKTDPEGFADKLIKLDSDRMQERVSLKHRGGSKFAKKQIIYNKYSDQSREAVQDMLHKSRELSKKVAVEEESSAEEDHEEDEVEDEESHQNSSSANPWMSTGIRIKKSGTFSKPPAVQNKDMEEDMEEEQEITSLKQAAKEAVNVNIDSLFDRFEAGKVSTVRQMKKKGKNIDDEYDLDDDDDDDNALKVEIDELPNNSGKSQISLSLKRKQTMEDFDDHDNESESDEEIGTQITKSNNDTKTTKQIKDSKQKEAISVDPNKFITLGGRSHKIHLAEEEDSDAEDEEDQSLSIAQAFAADDVMEEFSAEKQSIKDRDKPKDLDLTLPGWGAWGGQDVQISKRRRKRFTLKAAPAAPRKDRDLNNVIISETKDNTISKHQVNQLPFPFKNSDQFESSIRQPIGKTWNPETAYKKLIKPKKVTRMGTVIAPMDKSQVSKKGKETGPEPKKRKRNYKKAKT